MYISEKPVNMKKILPIITTFLALNFLGNVKAQDTLFLKNGTVVPSKILQVSSSEISYKRMDNPDGPTFTTPSSDIFVVKYQNGVRDTIKTAPVVTAAVDANPPMTYKGYYYKQGNNRMKEKEAYGILKGVNDAEINGHIKKAKFGKGMQNIGFVAIPAVGFCVGYTIYTLVMGINSG